jgi:hypothetical protein
MPEHDLSVVWVDIDAVQQHPDNANNGDVEAIAESIHINGLFDVLKVQRSTGYILAGNHTYLAQLEQGRARVPVIYLDVDDLQAKRILVAANQTARRSMDDEGQLWALLDEIRVSPEGLMGTGFTPRDVDRLDTLMRDPLTIEDLTHEHVDISHGGPSVKYGTGHHGLSINVTVDEDGRCESLTLWKPDLTPFALHEYLAIRHKLGLVGHLTREQIAEIGVPAWE